MASSYIDGNNYNHALFDSMAMFANGVIRIDMTTSMVDVLMDTFNSEIEGKSIPVTDFLQTIIHDTHPDYVEHISKSLSISHLKSLRGPESFENQLMIDGRYHTLQVSVTVERDDTEDVSAAFIAIRDIQAILDKQEQTIQEHRHLEYKVNSVLSAASMGTWSMDIGAGSPCLYGDRVFMILVGCPHDSSPEQAYYFWFSHIDREYVTAVLDWIDQVKDGGQSEITYLYHHPEKGRLIIRSGGMREPLFIERGVKLRGYHQDITKINEKMLQQLELGSAITAHYNVVMNIDLKKTQARIICDRNRTLAPTTTNDGTISMDLSPYYYTYSEKSVTKIRKYTNMEFLASELQDKGSISVEIEHLNLGWIRVTFVPSTFDQEGNVEHCICCTENIDEYKQKEIRQQQKLEKTMTAEKKEREALAAIAGIYHTSHIINIVTGEFSQLNAVDYITAIVGRKHTSAQNLIQQAIVSRFEGEHLPEVLDFINFKTLPERLKGKTNILMEALNQDDQWFQLSFIRLGDLDADVEEVVFVTQNIDTAKREALRLEKRSTTDELTQLFNRYSYEEDLKKLEKNHFKNPVWYINFDLNGLKQANDTKGHAAGDELIMAAARCMQEAFSGIGKAYRIGGDEFVAILKGDQKTVNNALMKLEKLRDNWHGELIDSFSYSKGVVCSSEYDECTIALLEREADHRMYAEKRAYHMNHIADRRQH